MNAHERLDDRVFDVCLFCSGDPDAEDTEEALHDDEAGQMRCSVFASASIGLLSYAGSMVQKPLLYRASCEEPGLYSAPPCVCFAAPLRPVEFEWVGPVSELLASTHLRVLGWRRFMQEPGQETSQTTCSAARPVSGKGN